jgi:hypothetical protein
VQRTIAPAASTFSLLSSPLKTFIKLRKVTTYAQAAGLGALGILLNDYPYETQLQDLGNPPFLSFLSACPSSSIIPGVSTLQPRLGNQCCPEMPEDHI